MPRGNGWKVVLCGKDPYISEVFFISVTCLSHSFLIIVKCSSIHRLKLGFVNDFIGPIGLICFTNLNAMHLRKSMRDRVY